MPFVSILIPIYGVEKYIERCATSLFKQTYDNLEYIFVNDCSPDKSVEILENLIQKYPRRISQVKIVHHSHNRGVSAARNTAIENSSGEFTIFVDSDDYMPNDSIAKLVKKQMESSADIVTGQVVRYYKNRVSMMERPNFYNHGDFVEDMIDHSLNHTLWGRLVRRSLYTDYNIKAKEGVNIGEDMQMIVPLVYYSQKTAYIWDIVYYYDCTNDNSCMNQHSGFNIKKLTQDIASMEIVHDFFEGKEEKFYNFTERHLLNYYLKLLDYYCEKGEKLKYIEIRKNLFDLKQKNRSMGRFQQFKICHYFVYRIKKYVSKTLS